MRVLVKFCVDADIIECPDFIISDLEVYQHRFREWLYDKNNKGFSNVDEYQKKYGMRKYIGYASTGWINSFILNNRDEKAYVVDKQINTTEMKSIPKIFFK